MEITLRFRGIVQVMGRGRHGRGLPVSNWDAHRRLTVGVTSQPMVFEGDDNGGSLELDEQLWYAHERWVGLSDEGSQVPFTLWRGKVETFRRIRRDQKTGFPSTSRVGAEVGVVPSGA